MTLLAEWGKLYQVTSKVGGYGVITDEAELSHNHDHAAVSCAVFHICIWLFASSPCVTVAFVYDGKRPR